MLKTVLVRLKEDEQCIVNLLGLASKTMVLNIDEEGELDENEETGQDLIKVRFNARKIHLFNPGDHCYISVQEVHEVILTGDFCLCLSV